jgi:hypothetical protein
VYVHSVDCFCPFVFALARHLLAFPQRKSMSSFAYPYKILFFSRIIIISTLVKKLLQHIVFRTMMPTNEEGEGDVNAYFTCKGYYANGLHVENLISSLLFTCSCNAFYSFPFSPFRVFVMLTVSL